MKKMDANKVATPYYGQIARPGYGMERLYLMTSLAHETGRVEKSEVKIWNGNSYCDLAKWLKDQGVDGFYAKECVLEMESELEDRQIWTLWNVTDEPGDIAKFCFGRRKIA